MHIYERGGFMLSTFQSQSGHSSLEASGVRYQPPGGGRLAFKARNPTARTGRKKSHCSMSSHTIDEINAQLDLLESTFTPPAKPSHPKNAVDASFFDQFGTSSR